MAEIASHCTVLPKVQKDLKEKALKVMFATWF